MDELLASAEWIISTRSDGEVLAVWVEEAGLRLGFLGDRQRFDEPAIRGLLTDLVHVALETSRAPAALAGPPGSIPIPLLLHHALSGLLFYQSELWRGEPAPCCVAVVEGEGRVALGWAGSGSVSVSVAERPYDPAWILVRDDSGQAAHACVIEDSQALGLVARWAMTSEGGASIDGELEARWPGSASVAQPPEPEARVGPAEPESAVEEEEPEIRKRPSRLWRFRSWMDKLAGSRRRAPESDPEEIEQVEPIAHDVPGVPDQISPSEPELGAESEPRGEVEPIAHDVPGVPDRIAPSEPELGAECEPRVEVEPARITEEVEEASPAGPLASPSGAETGEIAWRDWTDPFDLGPARLTDPDLAVESVPGGAAASTVSDSIEPEMPAVSAMLDLDESFEDAAPAFTSELLLIESEWAMPAGSEAAPSEPASRLETVLSPLPDAASAPAPASDAVADIDSLPASEPAPDAGSVPLPTSEPVVSAMESSPCSAIALPEAEPAANVEASREMEFEVPGSPEIASPSVPEALVSATEVAIAMPAEACEIEPAIAETSEPAPETSARAEATPEADDVAPVSRAARVRHPAWPELEEIARPRASAGWKRTGSVVAVVVALFAAGWLLGRFDFATGGKRLGAGLRALGLGPARYEVEVTSNPSAAWISVDGVDQTLRTPATLRLPPGPHRIGLSIGGAGGSTHAVQGKRGERLSLDVQLRGSLAIRVPEGSVPTEVAIDGVPQGYAPLTAERLSPGIHRLQFSGPGLSPWEQTVEVQVDRVTEVMAAPIASPATGMLDVRATLADEAGSEALPGATVWIDGVKRGVTPLRLELPRGPHSVRAGYHDEEAAIEVIELPGGNERFVTLEFGIAIDRPRLQAALPDPIPLDRPTVLSATLDRARPGEVREMWLHVRTPEGAWRRYPMNVMKAEDGLAGVAVFPVVLFDAHGRTAWYVSATTPMGDEYFTEIQTALSGRAR